MTMEPPEAPTEGRKIYLSKVEGQMFLKKWSSKCSFFVCWRHTISQWLSTILSL